MKKGKKIVKIVLLLVIVVAIASAYMISNAKPITYRTFDVTRGDIKTVISGSGTITASKSRKEYAKVSAEITDVYFEEGDAVKSGDIIMKLDSTTFQNNIESQLIAIEQSKLSKQTIEKQISDLKIVSNANGYVNNLTISEGSYVTTASPICDIVRNSTFEITLQFVYNENTPIHVGDSATITVLNSYSMINGKVTKISDMRKIIDGNAQIVEATIEVVTSGYSLDGAEAKAEIYTGIVSLVSVNQSKFSLVKENTVRAKSTGTVKTMIASNGMYVNKGDVIAVLENADLTTSLKNTNLTLQNQYNQLDITNDQLENYEVVSTLDGIITSQPYDEGDLVAAGSLLTSISNKEMMEFKIPVDELDVAKIGYDKKVKVTIDALPETEINPLEGRIALIPLEGTTTSGITDYYVTIELPGNDDIRISMSANADIIAESVENVLYIPIDAVTKKDGKSYVEVLVVDNEGNQITEEKEIKTGASDTTYIEVKSGLKEGEKVVIPTASTIHTPSASGMMQMRGE